MAAEDNETYFNFGKQMDDSVPLRSPPDMSVQEYEQPSDDLSFPAISKNLNHWNKDFFSLREDFWLKTHSKL